MGMPASPIFWISRPKVAISSFWTSGSEKAAWTDAVWRECGESDPGIGVFAHKPFSASVEGTPSESLPAIPAAPKTMW